MKKNFWLLAALAMFLGGGLRAQTEECEVKSVPYLEDFEAASWTENTLNCWTIINNNNDEKTWAKDATSGVDKSACAKYSYDFSNAADDYLVSPQIDLNKNAVLNFKIKTGSDKEKYSVLLSKTGKDIADFTDTLQAEQEIKYSDFQMVSIDLADYVGEKVYIAIKASSEKNKYYLYVDNFMVVSCGAPAGITTQRLSASDYEITWNTSAGQTEFSYKKTAEASFTTAYLTENKYTLSNWDDNTSYTVRLRAVCGEGDTSLYSDTFTFTTGYHCEAPSGMVVEKKDNGYELSWTSFAAKALVYYKKSEAADYTCVEATGQTHLFTDLDAGALYMVKLRSLCAAEDTSLYSADYTFITECGMATIPYLEDFEALHWINDKALLCWTIIDNNNDDRTWEKNNANGVNGSGCARYSYHSSNPADDYLISPQIDLNKNATLSFKIKTGSGDEKYSVLLSESGKNAADFTTVLQAESVVKTSEHQTVNIDLSSYTGKKVYIAIKASSDKNQWGINIDDFMVVSCGAPTGLSMAEITPTSVKVDFVSSAANYVVAYKKASATEWMERNATSHPVELTDLDPGYAYQVKVKALCSADDESLYSEVLAFNTPCVPASFPLVENFQSVSMPYCWDSTDFLGYGGAWKMGHNYEGYYAQFEGTNRSWGKLSSPDVNIEGVDLDRIELSMTYNFSNYDTKGESFYVSISTDKGLTYDTIREFAKNNAKETVNIPLKEYVKDAATVRVRFESMGLGSSGFNIKLYEVKIRLAPICFPPTDLHIEGDILYNEATLAWSAPDSTKDGAVKAYNVVYGALESEDVQTKRPTDTTITLDGLTQHTQYEAKVSTVCQTESSEEVRITWETPYSCLKVDNLKLNVLLPAEAVVSWQSKHENFEIRYKEDTAAEWVTVENIATKTYTLQGLKPAAAYVLKVRAVCASDDASLWDSLSFATPHGVVNLPYAENFENTKDSVPAYWQYSKYAGTDSRMQWVIKNDRVKEGRQALAFNASQIKEGNVAVMSTPLFDFSYDAVYTLEFWIRRTSSYAAKADRVKFFVSASRTDTVGAQLIATINQNVNNEPAVTDKADDDWYHYSYELNDVEGLKYILLFGISEYGDWIYIDDFKVNALYETNLGIVKVDPIVPRADLGMESVSLVLNNTGLDAFSGNANLCFSVDGGDTVRESRSFVEEPIEPETEYSYTFTAKADFSEIGEHELNVWVEAEGDPAFDNAASIKAMHYAPLSLPYVTFFCDSIAQEEYIYTMNLNQDTLCWTRREADSGMYLAPNADTAAKDLFFTPGVQMSAGIYHIEVAYGTAAEGKTEKMRLDLTEAFDTVGGLEVAVWNNITQTDTATVHEVRLDKEGIYMLRFTANSAKGQGGLNVFGLKMENTLSYIDLSASICEGDIYPFAGGELTEAGIYRDTIRHEAAADTIITLALTVNPVYGFSLDTTVCEGQQVEFGGRTYTESVEFKKEYKTVNGCDSVYSLKLVVNPRAAAPVISGKEDEGKKQWTLTAVSQEPKIQWYRNSAEIDGASELVYVATQEGTYHAVAENNCGKSGESNKVEVKFSVANQGADMAKMPSVYPNPAREMVYLKAVEPIERVAVYAANGKTVKKITGRHSEELSLSVRDLKAGIYVLQITLPGGVYNYKLVVNE